MKKGLLDFLQAASNAVADNVAGPVDLLNAGLGTVGLGSREPVGGTAWQQRMGLRRPVEQGAARVAGETVGLLSPTLMTAKAPQIARGLLAGADNLAQPATLNPQAGAIVWHGSPHTFDRFDASRIGTGEGNQSYGRGLYLADSPDVARQYADALGTHKTTIAGKPVTPDMPDYTAIMEIAARGYDVALRDARAALASGFMDPKYQSAHVAALERLGPVAKTIKQAQEKSIYKVDLPDPAIARMLDWDKPLAEQAPAVRAAIEKTRGLLPPNALDDLGGDLSLLYGDDVSADSFLGTMNSLRPNLGEEALRKAGVPGVRYLDQQSRNAGQFKITPPTQTVSGRWMVKGTDYNSKGLHFDTEAEALAKLREMNAGATSNYVVFPGEEGLLSILERNGKPLR
jgi:hypothetical protein